MSHPATYQYFFRLYTWNQIRMRFRGAYLGFAWNLLQPALYLLLLGGVFSVINRSSYSDFVVYLFAGLIPWRFFEQASLAMMDSIHSNSLFTNKIYIPYFYFPLIRLSVAFFDFLCSFVILLLLIVLFQGKWHFQMMILPLSILTWLLIALGAGLSLSVLYIFFQDIRVLVQMILMLLLFSSTIFFKVHTFSRGDHKLWFLAYNPVCYWAALFQKPVYGGMWPQMLDWTVSLASGALFLLIGIGLYQYGRDKFYYYF